MTMLEKITILSKYVPINYGFVNLPSSIYKNKFSHHGVSNRIKNGIMIWVDDSSGHIYIQTNERQCIIPFLLFNKMDTYAKSY